jgi:hypothetical protein
MSAHGLVTVVTWQIVVTVGGSTAVPQTSSYSLYQVLATYSGFITGTSSKVRYHAHQGCRHMII